MLKPAADPQQGNHRLRNAGTPAGTGAGAHGARGIKVDRQMLSRLSGDFAQGMAALESRSDMAGEDFNVGSPKQLGDILFGKMGLPGGKKTKTGAMGPGLGAGGACRRRP
jgi:hypothetical protein